MDGEGMSRVEEFLAASGYDPASMSQSTITRLDQIDAAVQARCAKTERAKELLKQGKITVLGISEDTGIPRKSIYNNPELRSYIDHCAKAEGEMVLVKASEFDGLHSRVGMLEERIDKLVLRDVDAMDLAHEIGALRGELERKDERIAELEKALAAAAGKAPGSEPKVVRFGDR